MTDYRGQMKVLIRSISFLFMSVMFCTGVQADETIAQRYVEDARLIGEARMKVLLWDVFDARLYASGERFDRTKPFALSLSYLRELRGHSIVETTISEMSRQGRFSPSELRSWEGQLARLIDDVDTDTTITGVRDENGHTLFYRDGQALGKITDTRFTGGFFDIWLGDRTSRPAFTRQLLGTANS
ncbi:MAG: hypothetical protein HKN42_12475 [Granulosicoccus sp.]|nr:hypothetical protein [Granulosicoccus sp.]